MRSPRPFGVLLLYKCVYRKGLYTQNLPTAGVESVKQTVEIRPRSLTLKSTCSTTHTRCERLNSVLRTFVHIQRSVEFSDGRMTLC